MDRLQRWLTGRDSLRARLTFIATFSFAVAFGLASVTLVRSVRDSLEAGARQDTREALTELVSQLQRGADVDDVRTSEGETVQFQITTPSGAVLGRTSLVVTIRNDEQTLYHATPCCRHHGVALGF